MCSLQAWKKHHREELCHAFNYSSITLYQELFRCGALQPGSEARLDIVLLYVWMQVACLVCYGFIFCSLILI